jgi:hypothetical protein
VSLIPPECAFSLCRRRTPGRWIRTLEGQSDIDERVLCVQKAVVDVRLLCEDLLSKNMHAVKAELKEVKDLNIGQSSHVGHNLFGS